jgi:nucleotide-binding universal stress UspA family protein
MPFKRVLCGIDFSAPSIGAFHTAVRLARQVKADLHVLHVIEAQPVVPGWLPADGLGQVTLMIEEKANSAMKAFMKSSSRALKGLKVSTEIEDGRAFVEIINRAHEWKADLIVIGAKGAASVEEMVAGGTAESVVASRILCKRSSVVFGSLLFHL